MANPRKFSEKIALHTQKQAEETAKFEQIMKEVSDVTAKVFPTTPDRGSNKHTLRINQSLGSFRGGSLPNVSAGGPKTTTHNKEIKSDQPDPSQMLIALDHVPTHQHPSSRNRSPSNVGPMRPRINEKRSPYGPYLSPPSDTSGWRRTTSDSALHLSAKQVMTGERNENTGSSFMLQSSHGHSHGHHSPTHHHSRSHSHSHSHSHSPEPPQDRPRSSCDVPSRVPGINIYPSAHEPGTVQIPIGNNTGSLPDLTSVHFPSPLHTPLDQEADPSSSPYSSSPVSASPATLSPTSVPGMRTAQGQFQFNTQHIPHHRHQTHLSVPGNSSYLHHNKGVTLENNVQGLVDGLSFTHPSLSLAGLTNIYQQQNSNSASSPTQTHPPQISGPGYRSPLPRPSPQSSPGLGGRHSEPSSPAAPSPIPDYIYNQTQASLQHSFEQFSMVDSPSFIETPTSVAICGGRQQNLSDVTSLITNSDLDPNNYYSNSPSPLVYSTQPPGMTTPNTPTSIPNIILTDFSSTTDDLRQDIIADELSRNEFTSKDLSNVISGALEAELFPSDESLRAGLGQLDFDGLQMLSDPDMSVISDNAEDHFRLDRL